MDSALRPEPGVGPDQLADPGDNAHFPNRSALKGLGSQNGVAPVIISAINRPVAGPSVNPQWPCPNASQSPR